MALYLWIILAVVLLIFYKTYYSKKLLYWKQRNVTHIAAKSILGTIGFMLFVRKPLPYLIVDMYNIFPNAKYVGFYQFTLPTLLLKDPEIIKLITVKDFDSFTNHTRFINEEFGIFGKNLLTLRGQKWRNMRATLSPAFTGSKMRTMFNLINDCAVQFVQYFLKEAKQENEMITMEMKDIFTRYTNDVIATTAFGIQCDSLANKENEFYMAGKKATNFTGILNQIKFIAFLLFPKLLKMLRIPFMDKKILNFFCEIILSALKLREKEGIIRPDMIHLLMEAKKGQLKHESVEHNSGFSAVEESNVGKSQEDKEILTDEDIISQAFLFFFAGYDTASTVLSFMAYELALNPEVQNKLYEEIENYAANDNINYESIIKMKYLDMVVTESLRKWPPGSVVDRLSSKTYTLEDTNDNEPPLLIEKDTTLWIPIYAIHHDPKYFPDPEKFDPERFSDENKDKIQPFTYIPFGVGPRNCIGSRFALLEIKVLFVHFLLKFEFKVVEKTEIPLQLDGAAFNFATKNGIWLGLKLRKSK